MTEKIRIFGPSVKGFEKRLYYNSTLIDDKKEGRVTIQNTEGRRALMDENTYDGLVRSNLVCSNESLPNSESPLWEVLEQMDEIYQSDNIGDEKVEQIGKVLFTSLVE